ncbi:hypothetical protein FDUTEX481_00164 [Tolypothrix sp. PCC 7601]|nr:hypothetical protein FDUTEX481_00164 [Tolypothrix sp. PCC 7601]BAY89070.1 hypothetical protein NIES3275_10730 [Microchaete diplosiphon NIES-3275]
MSPTSTARRNSKFKIQNSKLRQSKRFADFEWSVYLRLVVLVADGRVIPQYSLIDLSVVEPASSIGGESPKPPPKLLFLLSIYFVTELYWVMSLQKCQSIYKFGRLAKILDLFKKSRI